MKMYFSIPISGRDYNFQKEYAQNVQQAFKRCNGDVITPFDIIKDKDTPYSTCMELCIYELLRCKVLILAEDWYKSPGCRMERLIAHTAQIPVVVLDEITPICFVHIGFPEPDELIAVLKDYQKRYSDVNR